MKDGKIPSHQEVDVVEIMKKIRQNAAKNRTELTADERIRREARSEIVTLLQNAQVPDVIADQIRQQSVFEIYDPRTLYFSSRPGVGRIIGWIRTILKPITKLFINLDPLAHEVHRLTILNNFYLRTIQDLILKTSSVRVDMYSMKKRSAHHHRSNDDRHSRYNNHHNHRRFSRDRHKREGGEMRNSAPVRTSSAGSEEPTA